MVVVEELVDCNWKPRLGMRFNFVQELFEFIISMKVELGFVLERTSITRTRIPMK